MKKVEVEKAFELLFTLEEGGGDKRSWVKMHNMAARLKESRDEINKFIELYSKLFKEKNSKELKK